MSGKKTTRALLATKEIALDGIQNIYALKARTALALLGIIIGTASVIAMLQVGHNARIEAMRQFKTLGIDLVSITPRGDGTAPTILPFNTVRGLPDLNLGIAEVCPLIISGGMVRFGHLNIPVNIVAATDSIYALARASIVLGRRTSDLDASSLFVVLGSEIAQEITTASGSSLQIGQQAIIEDQVLTIIGVLAAAPLNPILGLDLNRSIVVPYASAPRLMSNPQISAVAARLSPKADDQVTAQKVTEVLTLQLRKGSVQVQTARQLIEGIEQQMQVYSLLILGIGAVSLAVGGIGVMNVMLMSIMERKKEIGLRLAVGARRRDIRMMFITESLILTALGSLLGTCCGTLAGWIFAQSSGWQFHAAPAALPLGAGMAIIVGIFFGSYPAACAARLDPIAALRSE